MNQEIVLSTGTTMVLQFRPAGDALASPPNEKERPR